MDISSVIKKVKEDKRRIVYNLWDNYLIRPIGKIFSIPFIYFNINPILIVILGFLFGLSGIFLIILNYYVIGFILFLIGIVFDNVDGITAYALNRTSALGKLLDETKDIIIKIMLWASISFLVFKNSQNNQHFLFLSILALIIPIFELMSFYLIERKKYYIYEIINKEKLKFNELILKLKDKSSNFFSESINRKIEFKILFFFKHFFSFFIYLWTTIFYPFLFFSLLFNFLNILIIFSFLFGLINFLFQLFRVMFYDRLILKDY